MAKVVQANGGEPTISRLTSEHLLRIPGEVSVENVDLSENGDLEEELVVPDEAGEDALALGNKNVDLNRMIAEVRAEVLKEQQKLQSDLRMEQSVIENNLRRTQKKVHGGMEEALIEQANILEAQHLTEAQAVECSKVLARQRREADERLERSEMKLAQNSMFKKMKAWQRKIHQLEGAQDLVKSTRLRVKESRDSFQLRLQHIQERQVKERKELQESQARCAANLQSLREAEMKHLSAEERAQLTRDYNLISQQLLVVQRKEAEQLRETQLLELKHMNKDLEFELKLVELREQMKADQKMEVQALEGQQKEEIIAEKERMAGQESQMIAMNLKEMQIIIASQLQTQQLRFAKELEREQKHRARARARQRALEEAEDLKEFMNNLSEDGGSKAGRSQKGPASSIGSRHDTDMSTEDRAAMSQRRKDQEDEEKARDLEDEERKEALLSQHRQLAEERSARDKAKLEQLQQNFEHQMEELRKYHADEFKRMETEHRRKEGQLKETHEEELKALKKDHAEEMSQLIEAQERELRNVRTAEEIERKLTADLEEERQNSNRLLQQILPKQVAEDLKVGKKVEPETFNMVTIFFSKIDGFSDLAGRSHPIQIVNLLNRLYTLFDGIIEKYDCYKVETIGDAYMVVSGLPKKNENHAQVIADCTLDFMRSSIHIDMSDQLASKINLRIGIHSGPVLAGVIGVKMPRFCLFGDTVNVASRMESTGEPGRIQISETTHELLKGNKYHTNKRGEIEVKGKGSMMTFFLNP
eukprot:Colp12_sorted_trinity150504_noHs@4843